MNEPWGPDLTGGASAEPVRAFFDHDTGFLPGDIARYAVVVARWDVLKGHVLALNAFLAATEVDPDLHLVFVGLNLHSGSHGGVHAVRVGS